MQVIQGVEVPVRVVRNMWDTEDYTVDQIFLFGTCIELYCYTIRSSGLKYMTVVNYFFDMEKPSDIPPRDGGIQDY